MTTTTPTVRPLRRREGIVAGVASGIAEHLSISAAAVRLIFVVLSLVGGAGIPLYVAGWLLIPAAGTDRSILAGRLGGLDSTTKQVAALVAGFLVVAAVLGAPPFTLLIAIGLGILAYRLLRD